ncbi:MAG TPA: hydrogenase formation protein HypD [Phycisphaerae bacterium]|nr:hydrogenase formation protein HypD [Phycisphaerae bacterium]
MAGPFDSLCEKIHEYCGSPALAGRGVQIMEVCGTHTVAIAQSGLRGLLPEALRLISGPGCPVCVTDRSYVDQALWLASGEDSTAELPIIATYGDMVRVPGSRGSLAQARAGGAQVAVVSSADQAVTLAKANPDRQVVFLAVGFETTAPGTALAVLRARDEGVSNFSALTAHKLILPAMRALLSGGEAKIDGFLCPGHVSVILGWAAYDEIVRDFGRPCVVAGFDPGNIVKGVEAILAQLVAGRPAACSVYPAVAHDGNARALKLLDEVFEPADATWRALGVIPSSGLALREEFAEFDAARRFNPPAEDSSDDPRCLCGEVITGRARPRQCALFGRECTPREPVGPCMVSSEGACATAYKYERDE